MNRIKMVFIGFGGYGNIYAEDYLKNEAHYNAELVGIVDPYPENGKYYREYKEKNIPFYETMSEFYADHDADLAVISTPIQFHTLHIKEALKHGSNVLCEKPLCGDPCDIDSLIEARNQAEKFVFIGYQWSHSTAIFHLKQDIMEGKFGVPICLKTLILWPRDDGYFNRTTKWAGKIKSNDGSLIYDSVANNAAAHYLHNMLYVLGDQTNTAMTPIDIKAELLRTNPIENFDTAHIALTMSNGAKLHFLASHTVNRCLDPVFEYHFEKGTVYFSGNHAVPGMPFDTQLYGSCMIRAVMSDGTITEYGNPFEDECRKLHLAIAKAGGEKIEELCGIETAAVHTRVIGTIQQNTHIYNTKKELRKRCDSLSYVEGLYEKMVALYNNVDAGSLLDFAEDDTL